MNKEKVLIIGGMGFIGHYLALKLCKNLRKIGKNVVMDSLRRSIKAQLREANKSGAKYALILGDEEILSNTIIIKDLKKGDLVKRCRRG